MLWSIFCQKGKYPKEKFYVKTGNFSPIFIKLWHRSLKHICKSVLRTIFKYILAANSIRDLSKVKLVKTGHQDIAMSSRISQRPEKLFRFVSKTFLSRRRETGWPLLSFARRRLHCFAVSCSSQFFQNIAFESKRTFAISFFFPKCRAHWNARP
jgi:hypothetical protein